MTASAAERSSSPAAGVELRHPRRGAGEAVGARARASRRHLNLSESMMPAAMSTEAGPSTDAEPEARGEPSGLACLTIVARHHGLHLSVAQLTRDNWLTGREVSVADLLKCGRAAGLKVSALRLSWGRLDRLRRTL